MGTTKLCIVVSGIAGFSRNLIEVNSAFSRPSDSVCFPAFSRSCYSAFNRPITCYSAPFSVATSSSVQADDSSFVEGAPNEKLEASSTGMVGANDLLIVGPGVLGRLVAEQWKTEFPGSQICGLTRTIDHHDELKQLGISPTLKGTQVTHKFPYVIYCAPPYQNPDYAGDVREATLNWNGEGSFVFTSSSAPYDCNDNGSCDEDTSVVPIGSSPRTDILLMAEKAVLEAGGCVVRLAGLYKVDRGAHSHWLEKGSADIRPDHILNLIHYEDAASLVICVLRKNLRGRVFLGCDSHPLSRKDLMDLVNKSGKYSKKFDAFTGTSDPLGKKLNNSKTRKELGWEPKYSSFEEFLQRL